MYAIRSYYETVETVKNSTVAGNDGARVLDFKAAFEHRLEQVANLRGRTESNPQKYGIEVSERGVV